jgi:hypothetical protein
VDELGVIVKQKGLELSKYTEKGVDKFENMNLHLIFGKMASVLKFGFLAFICSLITWI